MRAAVFRGPGRITVQERHEPAALASDETLVAPLLVGLCGTDRGIYLGRYRARPGVTLGHEAVATVVAVGSKGSALRPGQRVVLDPTRWCGTCDACRAGTTRFCRHKGELEIGIAQDGALAERLVVPEVALQRVPDAMSSQQAVLVEPLACVMNAATTARLGDRDRVTVLGAGPLGLLWALLAGRSAQSVQVVETDSYRRCFATALLGEAAVTADPPRRDADLVVDTTGHGVETAVEIAADAGGIVLMGCDVTAIAHIAPFVLTARGLSLIGAADYDAPMFANALRLAGELGGERLITHRFALADIGRAIDHLSPRGEGYRAVKVVIEPQSP